MCVGGGGIDFSVFMRGGGGGAGQGEIRCWQGSGSNCFHM